MATKGTYYRAIGGTRSGELGQVVGKAGFLVEFALESMTVYAGENQVSVQADVRFTGAGRSGRSLNAFPAQVDTR